MTTPNRFQAVLAAVRAGDDQARREAETARARRADHWFHHWFGQPTRRPSVSCVVKRRNAQPKGVPHDRPD